MRRLRPLHALLALAALALAGLAALTGSRLSGLGIDYRTAHVTRGPLAVWTAYEGTVLARSVTTVMSQLNGSAVITTLAPEGATVQAGDLLMTLDASALEREILGLERDLALAEAERDNLAGAVHPLRRRELSLQIAEARAALEDERAFLEDNRDLAAEGLVSDFEVRQQEGRVDQARLKLETHEQEIALTTNVMHPSELRRAEARAAAARETLALLRAQLASCIVRAPTQGTVVYLPVHVAGEYRAVRVGDAVFKNQPFLALHDMRELVAQCDVPEAELARVGEGRRVVVTPLAYPDLRLDGEVESIGSVAGTRPGQPGWKKYFQLEVGLAQAHPALRSGMSVHCMIESGRRGDALLVPRAAVWWEAETPYCNVIENGRARARRIEVGLADERHFEVLAGLAAGEEVRMP